MRQPDMAQRPLHVRCAPLRGSLSALAPLMLGLASGVAQAEQRRDELIRPNEAGVVRLIQRDQVGSSVLFT